jgi:hypothetical protein
MNAFKQQINICNILESFAKIKILMNTWVKLKNISDGKAILVIGKCREKLQA